MDNPNQSAQSGSSPKTISIIAHITLIGWIIALVMHSSNKSSMGTFYLRQMLGLVALGIAGSLAAVLLGSLGTIISYVVSIANLVFWIMSLIGAVNNEEKLVPIVGEYFQDWFKFID